MPRIMQKAKSVAGVKDAGLAPKRPAATVQKAVLGGDGSQPKGLTVSGWIAGTSHFYRMRGQW